MSQRVWSITGALALLLALLMGGIVACGRDDDGGGSGDEGKIKARMESFFNHLTKADAKGLINDLPPDIRKDCDEAKIKEAAEFVKEFNLKLKGVKVTSVSGNNGVADITVSATFGEESDEQTSPQKFIKVSNNWYIDNEGKSCTEFIET